MEAAFDKGYDSDGWTGPSGGTDKAEIEAAEEEALPEAPPMVQNQVITEAVHVPISPDEMKAMKVGELKDELNKRQVGLPKDRRKPSLMKRLQEALDLERPVHAISNDQKQKGDDLSAFAMGAYWKELTPDVDTAEPVNADFPSVRAPTVPADEQKVPPRPKQGFSMTFDRPVYKGRMKGGPVKQFLEDNDLTKDSLPVEFVDAFIPMFENPNKDANGDPHFSIEYLTRYMNAKANLSFAGEATYQEWSEPFSIKECRQHLGLFILNGLSPSPGLERKFNPKDKANFNPFVSQHFGSNPGRRLKQFKAFMTCQDPLKGPPNRADSPLFKVLGIIKWIRIVGPMSWECGIDVGLDEQTIGFKGQHVHKLRITYKTEGDGFQCDALCDDGFTYSVFFRNEKPPSEFIRMGLSPLHARSIWLFNQLKEDYHRAWADNLYLSAKFCKAAYESDNKILLSGVARATNRGVPRCVETQPVKKAKEASVRGMVKAAVLEDDDNCPGLVCMMVYDQKPVHFMFMSMACETIKWILKKQEVWNQQKQEMVEVNFLRVNLNGNYNHKMNDVDISDQLRNVYRMDHWLRQRKWWWAIFLWGYGVLLTNAYIVYLRLMEEAGVPKQEQLSHYDFLHSVAVAWIDTHEVNPRELRRRRARERRKQQKVREAQEQLEEQEAEQEAVSPNRESVRTPARRSPARAQATAADQYSQILPEPTTPSGSPKRPQCPQVQERSLHPQKGALRGRLNHFGVCHCPETKLNKNSCYALHRILKGREIGKGGKFKDKIIFCSECKVHLCMHCFRIFHTEPDIVAKKDELANQLPSN